MCILYGETEANADVHAELPQGPWEVGGVVPCWKTNAITANILPVHGLYFTTHPTVKIFSCMVILSLLPSSPLPSEKLVCTPLYSGHYCGD